MRRINYDTFKKSVKAKQTPVWYIRKRAVRRKPRDPQEMEMLLKHALARKEQALATKEFEILSKGRWRVNAKQDDLQIKS